VRRAAADCSTARTRPHAQLGQPPIARRTCIEGATCPHDDQDLTAHAARPLSFAPEHCKRSASDACEPSAGHLKLADFGLSKIYGSPEGCRTPQVFARWYRAPELLYGSTSYGPAADVWAMGCVFAELLLRRPWFVAESDIKQLQAIFGVLGTPTAEQWAKVGDLPSYVAFTPAAGVPLHKVFPRVRAAHGLLFCVLG
jgi:serine/threonine protein kinase